MKYKHLLFTLFIFAFSVSINAQTTVVKGIVKNSSGFPISDVAISYNNRGTTTNKKGKYNLTIPIKKTIQLVFTHLSYKTVTKIITAKTTKAINLSLVMDPKTQSIKEIKLNSSANKVDGLINIKENKFKRIPGANQGIENLLKTLPGVSSNNELSTQYNVRGGNYDENLVYINGIEVYRPFLVRSGKQEGLSIVNPNLTKNVNFSAGGFEAKYGDKLSSVLDITYKKPKKFGVSVDASFLGGSVTMKNASKNKKFSSITGVRYRNNSLFFSNNSYSVSSFKPNYTDVQSYISYKFNKKISIDFLNTISINDYLYKPISRIANFGTLNEPKTLVVDYRGKEEDKYSTLLHASKVNYNVNDNFFLNFTSSIYHTKEEEHFDINASYNIKDSNSDFKETQPLQTPGYELKHARNDLDAKIYNVQIKGKYVLPNSLLEFGGKYQIENIKDRIIEWEVIDSAGFLLRPPTLISQSDQTYLPFDGPIVAYQNTNAKNDITINRFSGFTQLRKSINLNNGKLWVNIGLRGQTWKVSGKDITNGSAQTIISPRAQLYYRPKSNKNMLFKISGGVYDQPPFYKELKDSLGVIHPNIKAQKSIHLVIGNDYSFSLKNRLFKLSTEAYYKRLRDVNSFTVENVRIRYAANNNTKAYAYGFEMRLTGEFVPNAESWVSFGYLNTKENTNNRGYIPRPTDQRLKFALLFQDYVPKYPNLKMYMNIVYDTGLPEGSPLYADKYKFQNRLPDYKRADIGISYIFKDKNNTTSIKWINSLKEFSAGIEIFNLFDIQNSITNTWVRDSSSKTYFAIPNYLTGRVFSLSIHFGI